MSRRALWVDTQQFNSIEELHLATHGTERPDSRLSVRTREVDPFEGLSLQILAGPGEP